MIRLLPGITTLLLLLALGRLWAQPCNGVFVTAGTATNQGGCIQLTANTTGQQGCTWLNTPVDFSEPISHSMVLYFGNNDAGGADGICLVYQPGGTGVCGSQGGGIGAQGIPNSFIVEFDTWDNGAGMGDIPADHCAVNLNGAITAPVEGPVALPNIEDGADHVVTFEWDPGAMVYSVYFDGVLRLSGMMDIVNNVFGGNSQVYWGYTASTGAASNVQRACPILPDPIIVDAGIDIVLPCAGASLTLDGTGSDQDPNYTFEWSTLNGSIVNGANDLTPTINAPGTYVLTLTDEETGCMETDQVTVTVNEINAIIDPPGFLTCSGPLELDGSGSTSGPNISYEWTTPDGNIVSSNGPFAQIDQEGNYTITVIYDDGENICTETFTTNVQADPDVPVASALGAEIQCDPPTTEVDGSGSSFGPNYAYQWSTNNGLILSGEFSSVATVGQPGSYTLLVTNTETGCTDEVTVDVTENTNLPSAVIAAPGSVTCASNQVVLNGANSVAAGGQGLTFQWATGNGVIISGQGTSMLTVGAPGQYTLFVTDNENGCEDQTTITVTGNIATPSVDIAPPLPITCSATSITLDATGSQTGAGFIYLWSTANGNILSGGNTLTPVVDAAGVYQLSITNPANGCTGTATATVAVNTQAPVADAGDPQEFICGASSLTLDGSGSSQGLNFNYQWTTADGAISGGAQTLSPTVSSAGLYQLVVVNQQNGCADTSSVLITNDNNAATVLIAVSDTLDCATTLAVLDASASSQGPDYSFEWTTANGRFVSGVGTLTPVVDRGGIYVLSITNLANNCVAVASVTVVQDTLRPLAVIAPPDTLNCTRTTLVLNGTASSQGANFVHQWTTAGGQLISGAQSLTPTVGSGGNYTLTIRNNANQCLSEAVVTVAQDTLRPSVVIAPPATLTCIATTATLDASASDPGMLASWTGGVADSSALITTANQPGNYTLTLQNSLNGCSQSATVTVGQNITLPAAEAGPDQVINCRMPVSTLQGQASSSGANIRYQWTTPDGQIDSGADTPQPAASAAGLYHLLVTDNSNGCQATDSVQVSANFTAPSAFIADPALLTCVDTLVDLDGSASSSGPDVLYSWDTPDGTLVGGAAASQAQAAQSGAYVLEVAFISNGCVARDTVAVMRDENFPAADVATPLPLTCTRADITLSGTAMAVSGNLDFSWSTPDGAIDSGANTLSPTVSAPGTYLLSVVDLVNNCRAQASIMVELDTLRPVASIAPAGPLTCATTQLALQAATAGQTTGFTYAWATSNGQIAQGAATPAPLIVAPGTYTLTVANTSNGCEALSSIAIAEDVAVPVPVVALPDTLTCTIAQLTLDAAASSSTAPPAFTWTTTDGHIVSGALTAMPRVDEPGTYRLVLRNPVNGCVDSVEAVVAQDVVLPSAIVLPADTLTCAVTTVTLQTTGSSTGPDIEYAWTTTLGNILSGANTPMPVIDAPGQYFLKITDLGNGCVSTASVQAPRDIAPPVVSLAQPLQLNCLRTDVRLDASGSSAGPQPAFMWSTANGVISADANSLIATATAPGLYTFTATNLVNGCTASDAITVFQNIAPPVVNAIAADTLDCVVSQFALSSSGSSSGPLFSYLWSTSNGNLLGDPASAAPAVDQPGQYVLFIRNTANGCTATDTVTVARDTLHPIAVIALPEELNCDRAITALDGAGSSTGATIRYEWTTANGRFTGPQNALATAADLPGQYTLVVRNLRNGCLAAATTTVTQDVTLPVVVIAPPLTLTCIREETTLDASASDSGPSFVISWTTSGGVFTGGQTTLAPSVNAPGSYTLTLENTDNGCENAASVTVSRDVTPPVARAGLDFVIPCDEPTANLNGSGSSAGAGFIYLWTTPDGQIAAGATTLSPAVSGPGLYQLSVTNLNNGCAAADEVVVSQRIPVAVPELGTPLCYGEPGSIVVGQVGGGVEPYLYSVNGGDFFQPGPVFNELPAGLYEVVVQDANGCEYRQTLEMTQPDSLYVVIPEPEVRLELGQDHQVVALTNASPDRLSLIRWEQNGSLSCGDCLTPLAEPLETSIYRITVRDTNGCQAQALLRIIVDRTRHVYVPNAFSPNGDGINDLLIVYARNESVVKVKRFVVFNRWGESVFEAYDFPPNHPPYGWDGLFRGQALQPAVFAYYAEVEFIDGVVEIVKGDVTLVK